MIRIFSEQRELIQFARRFIGQRLDSLEKDVNHCLRYPYAPFPALLYCFSTIDLLGALYSGNATKKAPTSKQSKEYMMKFMSYTAEQSDLLQQLFRHKIVHLAQPGTVVHDERKNRYISWKYEHDNLGEHLKIKVLPEKAKYQVTSSMEIEWDHVFIVSIKQLVKDIRYSVEGPNGYLAELERKPEIQDRFEQAIKQIFFPQ